MPALAQEKINTCVNLCCDKKLLKISEKIDVLLPDVRRNNRLCLYQNNPE